MPHDLRSPRERQYSSHSISIICLSKKVFVLLCVELSKYPWSCVCVHGSNPISGCLNLTSCLAGKTRWKFAAHRYKFRNIPFPIRCNQADPKYNPSFWSTRPSCPMSSHMIGSDIRTLRGRQGRTINIPLFWRLTEYLCVIVVLGFLIAAWTQRVTVTVSNLV